MEGALDVGWRKSSETARDVEFENWAMNGQTSEGKRKIIQRYRVTALEATSRHSLFEIVMLVVSCKQEESPWDKSGIFRDRWRWV
jgi:hypothetical protein